MPLLFNTVDAAVGVDAVTGVVTMTGVDTTIGVDVLGLTSGNNGPTVELAGIGRGPITGVGKTGGRAALETNGTQACLRFP